VCSQGTTFAPHLTYDDPGTMYQMNSANFIRAAFMGMPMPAQTSGPAEMPSTTMTMPSMSMTSTSTSSSTATASGATKSGASARIDCRGMWLSYAFVLFTASVLVIEIFN
jgi:hypothetical protein